MGLKTAIAADLRKVFLRLADFAETGTYTPQDGGAFAIIIAPGDAAPQATGGDGGQSQEVRVTATCSKADYDAGNPGKIPLRGDLLTIASGDMAGVWRVDGFHADSGGGLSLYLVRSDQFTYAASGSREL